MDKVKNQYLLKLSTKIVSAYVSNHNTSVDELMNLIDLIYRKLSSMGENDTSENVKLIPAVPIEESILPESLVCLEDGKKFKLLKRHLATNYNMSPEQYREKWKLPPDYPMVAPSYSKKRRELAKVSGLGKSK